MPRRSITPFVAAAICAALLPVALGISAPAAGAAPRPALRSDSVRAPADSSLDPSLSIGVLPDGMHYFLRPNAMPSHRVELRLVVDAGSRIEADDQRGFAHFLEHMAFNGTTHFPGSSLVDFIETNGMRFGADLNAFTSFDETVYTLTLPTDDRRTVARGLDALQDWADGGITIDSSEVVAERGVVMGEWRMRLPDTASQTVSAHYDSLMLGGSAYLTRKPIGDTTLIEGALPAPIRRFYRDWYTPDRMAVVVVGDFDRAAMLREIRRRFGRIAASKPAHPYVAPSLPTNPATVVDIYRGNVTPNAELLWPVPAQPAGPTAALQQRVVYDLLWQGLEQRLLHLREHPSRPFVTAEIESGRVVRPLNLVGVQLIAWPDSIERAIGTVVSEIERVAQNGVAPAALERQKAAMLRHYESAAASETAIPSRTYAEQYVAHFLTGEGTLMSPQQELAAVRAMLPRITTSTLAEAARFWREPAGRKVFVGLPLFDHARPPTRESVLAIFDSVSHARLAPDSDATRSDKPLLARLPAPGRIVSEKDDAKAGITEWTLSNGARVILKPSRNDPDQLLVRAWSAGGFSVLPDSLFFTPGRMVAKVMTDVGGLGATGHDALVDKLSSSGLSDLKVDIGFSDQSVRMDGSPRDAETLFQALYLQFTAPMLDSVSLAGWQNVAKYQGTEFTIDDQFNQAFARGEPRLLPVSTNVAELTTVKDLMNVYHDLFGNAGEFTFTIVGAITKAEARPLVERYIASLPSAPRRERKLLATIPPFLHRVESRLPSFDVPKAQTLLVFDGAFPSEPEVYLRERQKLSALVNILQDRLRVRLREQLGGTYSPYITSETLPLTSEHYRVMAGFDAAPERMFALGREMLRIVDSMRTYPVSAVEAERAAVVQRRQLETSLQENDYWMARIGTYSRLGIPLDRVIAPYSGHVVSPAEIQEAAKKYLPGDTYVHVTVMPADSTSYPVSSSSGGPGREIGAPARIAMRKAGSRNEP